MIEPARAAWLILAVALILGVLLVAAIISRPARAEDSAFCLYWSREAVRLDLLSQPSVVVTPATIESAVERRFNWCGNQETGQRLALPGREEDHPTPAWSKWLAEAHAARQARVAELGTAPADVGEPGWIAACEKTWRTFDRSTGTVVRPRSGGKRVRCPLVLRDGEWVLE